MLLYITSKLVSVVVVHWGIPWHKGVVVKAMSLNMACITWRQVGWGQDVRFNDGLHQSKLGSVVSQLSWFVASLDNSSHYGGCLSLEHRLFVNLGKSNVIVVLFALLDGSKFFIKLRLWLLIILAMGDSGSSNVVFLKRFSPSCTFSRSNVFSYRSKTLNPILVVQLRGSSTL